MRAANSSSATAMPGRWTGGFILPVLAVALVVAFSGCATAPERPDDPPVSDHAAVVGWADSARELRDRKQFEQAAAKLERALRVEPGNARLWHELARVHLEQGNADQAIQFAYKSDALARDERLKSRNRRLIDAARSLPGATGRAD